jgi:hypothetical protein
MPAVGFGLGTLFHAVPFQCRITVREPPPTAQAFLTEVAATADTQQMMADCAVLPERLGRAAPAAPVALAESVNLNEAPSRECY